MVAGEQPQSAQSVDQALSRYARYGADVWASNPSALISGEGGACISCHTSLPYALVEPLLPGSYPAYTDLINNVNNRVVTWSENTAWYSDEKLEQTAALSGMPPEILIDLLDAKDSRGVEAVLNAVILTMHDAVAWIERQLANPYPAEPRHNTHDSADEDLPQFRNNLYTNAGHMWAYLARMVHAEQAAPWGKGSGS